MLGDIFYGVLVGVLALVTWKLVVWAIRGE